MTSRYHEAPMTFWQRHFPSANMVLVHGRQPVLVDTGFGTDLAETQHLLVGADCPPDWIARIINTHYHSDHVGGNAGLQRRYGIPVGAHQWEAAPINHRDPEAFSATWLDQPVDPYQVEIILADGAEIPAGDGILQVVHTPGHTLGHIALYHPPSRILICGDAVHRDDVAWLNPFREGAGALERTMSSLDRLAGLPARLAFSGHGPPITDVKAALDQARQRYESWLRQPEKAAWHACKRIFAYALMLYDGMPEEDVPIYLLGCPWFRDFSLHVFHTEPADFVRPLLREMLRSGAVTREHGRLLPNTRYTPPA